MKEPKYFMSTAVEGGMWRVSGLNDLVEYWDQELSGWMTSTVETLKDLEEDSTCYRTDSYGNPLDPIPHVGQGMPVESFLSRNEVTYEDAAIASMIFDMQQKISTLEQQAKVKDEALRLALTECTHQTRFVIEQALSSHLEPKDHA